MVGRIQRFKTFVDARLLYMVGIVHAWLFYMQGFPTRCKPRHINNYAYTRKICTKGKNDRLYMVDKIAG